MIYTSRHSIKSAFALGEALGCAVYNPYSNEFYREGINRCPDYNMGCSNYVPSNCINHRGDVSTCVSKLATFYRLEEKGVLVLPYTDNKEVAQSWLNEDKIVVNRRTITGKANEGLSYSYKNAPGITDKPLDNKAILWTRYVNHSRELRAYCFKHEPNILFEKVEIDGQWVFNKIKTPDKLRRQLVKAQQAFSGMSLVAFDILECVSGNYYFLEANSAPSLLVHSSIIPTLVKEINHA